MSDLKTSTARSFFWKLLERFGVQGGQFVLQIILARLLDPEHYGVLSIMVIFTTLANVFVQSGLNTALIQGKDVEEDDYSSVFWITLGVAVVLYLGLYFCTPLIASFYKMPDIIQPFRILSLMLIPGAFNSIQLAKVSREMNFKKVFFSSVWGICVSGAVSIAMAYMGAGLWSLVAQSLLNAVVVCIVMWVTVKWRPKLICNLKRVKILFSFGWKLLVSGLIDTLYQDLRSLVIGKKYSADTLGFYNRGKQFPQFMVNSINGTVQSVMLPAMAAEQEHRDRVKAMMRKSMTLSAYIIFPMMAGLAGVATPLVKLILTDKWLPCVPYLQVYCFTFAFYPVHSCNLQAMNAMGRSDMFLRLEIIKKIYGIVALVIAVFCFDSPLAIAMTGVVTTVISCFVNASPNKKLINYSYFEQMKDVLPFMLAALAMLGAVLVVGTLPFSPIVILLLQILVGVIVYVGISVVARFEPFTMLLNMVRNFRKKKI